MAIESLERISTNLPFEHLQKVATALDKGGVEVVPGSVSGGNEGKSEEFKFEGATYYVSEHFETVDRIKLISGSPDIVQTLIDKLEGELSTVVEARDYGKAERINAKIKNLKKVLTGDPSSHYF
jgi:hypothetical protein